MKLVLAAFDELKARYGVERFAISGFSSGGHLVGALLAKRNDIVCAVAASGVLAVRQRIQWRGWVTDITGFSDYYDPITQVDRIPSDANRRIFIIGDPRDINAPFVAQESYAKEVARHGHAVWLMKAEGVDRARHYLGGKELNVAKWCLDGETAESIEKMIGYRDP
ncbi:MAG: hypothetical protein FJX47_13240 [Alphaproteobacteria bacterium]|nr:hypothetical protein [Alphaproteobacteria bacterium]